MRWICWSLDYWRTITKYHAIEQIEKTLCGMEVPLSCNVRMGTGDRFNIARGMRCKVCDKKIEKRIPTRL